jgi:hypothetical protein
MALVVEPDADDLAGFDDRRQQLNVGDSDRLAVVELGERVEVRTRAHELGADELCDRIAVDEADAVLFI